MSNEINSNYAPIFMLIFPFGVGGAILILIAPLLLICCCFRPWCCRSIYFWRRDDSDWTWKELKLPALLGGILVLGTFAAAIAGFVFISELKVSYDNSICARAIVFDDLLNGNRSSETGNYFVGLQKFQNEIPNFL